MGNLAITRDNWRLLNHDGHQVQEGQKVIDFRGEAHTIKSGTPPHKSSSTGRIYTAEGREFYPSVVNCKWEEIQC
jgi:hypothetical protein